MAFRSPWRQRQHRIDPVERLNRRLLVDAEDDGVLRRVEIEADHVRRFRLEVGIRRAQVALQPMRLQAGVAPRPGGRCLHAELGPNERVDQWVAPCGGARRVQARMRACTAGVSTVGFEPRCPPSYQRPRRPRTGVSRARSSANYSPF